MPHDQQNRARSGFSSPQFGQRIMGGVYEPRGALRPARIIGTQMEAPPDGANLQTKRLTIVWRIRGSLGAAVKRSPSAVLLD